MDMKKIPPKVAAAVMGVGEQFIRVGLQRGLLPFGTAYQVGGKKRYTYFISPPKFFAYTGASEADVIAAARRIGLEPPDEE